MFKCPKCGAATPQTCTCDSSLTAEQVDSEQVDSAQVERYRLLHGVEQQYLDSDGVWRHFFDHWPGYLSEEAETECAELVRRANALPTVEARLKEAVKLLRDGLPWMDGYCKTFPASWGRIENWLNDSRTFLAKGDA